jgi:signal transduction histidine kinase
MMFTDKKLLARLDKMLEDGINGTFSESDYDETQLSKLESKWLRYLTSSKLSAQKTEQEREKLQELVSDISHQTKTPLSNILLYTQLLQEQDIDGQSRQLVDEIRQQSEKLEFLIQSLVKTSRLETGTFQLAPLKNNIDSVIDASIEQITPKAKSKQIKIMYSSQSHTAKFDIKWTREALFNILDNAVKYSPRNSVIKITVYAYEMFACVSVADQGIGIPEEELPRIFGRFYRGQNVKEQNGVGIGLYLCRQIIEGQGGYITVESTVNQGSIFKIFLPR